MLDVATAEGTVIRTDEHIDDFGEWLDGNELLDAIEGKGSLFSTVVLAANVDIQLEDTGNYAGHEGDEYIKDESLPPLKDLYVHERRTVARATDNRLIYAYATSNPVVLSGLQEDLGFRPGTDIRRFVHAANQRGDGTIPKEPYSGDIGNYAHPLSTMPGIQITHDRDPRTHFGAAWHEPTSLMNQHANRAQRANRSTLFRDRRIVRAAQGYDHMAKDLLWCLRLLYDPNTDMDASIEKLREKGDEQRAVEALRRLRHGHGILTNFPGMGYRLKPNGLPLTPARKNYGLAEEIHERAQRLKENGDRLRAERGITIATESE